MQFETDCLSMESGELMVRRYAELKSKKLGIAS